MNILLQLLSIDAVQVALIGLLVAGVTAATKYAVAVARDIHARITHEVSASQLALLRAIASDVVKYVEQAYKDVDGPAKLDAAVAAANPYLKAYGIKVTAEQLRAIIEAAVFAEVAKRPLPDPASIVVVTPPES